MSDVERLHWWLLLVIGADELDRRGYGQLAKDLRSVAMSAFSKPETKVSDD